MVIAVIESINYAYSNYKYIPWNVDFIENFFLLQIVWIIKKRLMPQGTYHQFLSIQKVKYKTVLKM